MRSIFFFVFGLFLCLEGVSAKNYTLKDQSKNLLKHRQESLKLRGNVGIIVASDTRREESGLVATTLLQKAGFKVKQLEVVPNLDVKEVLSKMLDENDIDAILCIGGTGISPHDVTIEAIKGVVEKDLPGYGELVRTLTRERWNKYEKDLGILSIDTRAMAGVGKGKIIFAVPGSPDGTQLAVSEVIIPGLPTLRGQLLKAR